MKTILPILPFLFLISCENPIDSKKKALSSDSIPPITSGDSMDKISSTTCIDSFGGRSICDYLSDSSILESAKSMFLSPKDPNSDKRADQLTDSLFSKNKNNAPFYFLVFTRMMPLSDGAYSEILSWSAKRFVDTNTMSFIKYFTSEILLTKTDLSNWARWYRSEMSIEDEHYHNEAIDKLKARMKGMCSKEEWELLIDFATIVENN